MNPLLDLKFRVEYVLLRSIVGLFRLLPPDRAADLLARLVRTIAPHTRRHRRALANLEIAFPEKTPEERDRIARGMWDNIGRVIAEMMQVDRIVSDDERFELDSDFFVKRYKDRVGPVVAGGMHMGNWELAIWPMTVLCNANAAGVYRLVKNPYADRYLRNQRRRLYPAGLFAKGRGPGGRSGHDSARQLSSFIREAGRTSPGTLGFMADLYDGKGIAVPFFGRDAKSTPFPAMVSRRIGARLWIGCCRRVGPCSRFHISFREIKIPRTEDADADIREVTAAVQHQFEQWIRETPEQYMWINRRFA